MESITPPEEKRQGDQALTSIPRDGAVAFYMGMQPPPNLGGVGMGTLTKLSSLSLISHCLRQPGNREQETEHAVNKVSLTGLDQVRHVACPVRLKGTTYHLDS